MRPVRRSPAEQTARKVLGRVMGGAAGLVALAAVVVPVAESYQSHVCDGAPVTGTHVRNSLVGSAITCKHGTVLVTTPRKTMRKNVYGWNCYYDGGGICGVNGLTQIDRDCLTRTDDGYTMCADGRVYYRDAAGTKLWPVMRAPS